MFWPPALHLSLFVLAAHVVKLTNLQHASCIGPPVHSYGKDAASFLSIVRFRSSSISHLSAD